MIVSCTLVDGALAAQSPGYYPQTVAALAGELTAIVWDPADHGLETFQPYQHFSCNLPPGVELNVVGNDYTASTPT